MTAGTRPGGGLAIAEPAVALTDALLAGETAVFAARLLATPAARRGLRMPFVTRFVRRQLAEARPGAGETGPNSVSHDTTRVGHRRAWVRPIDTGRRSHEPDSSHHATRRPPR